MKQVNITMEPETVCVKTLTEFQFEFNSKEITVQVFEQQDNNTFEIEVDHYVILDDTHYHESDIPNEYKEIIDDVIDLYHSDKIQNLGTIHLN